MPSKMKVKTASSSKAASTKSKAKSKLAVSPTKLQKRAVSSSVESEQPDGVEDEEEEDELASVSEEDDGWEDASDGEGDSDEDEEDVDGDGMERLMKALGEDGLDDFAQEQLRALEEGDEDEDEDAEEESEEEEDEDAEETASGVGEEDEEGSEEDNEEDEAKEAGPSKEVPIPVDEISDEEMLDEDAMPRQKVEIDNKIAMERIRATIALDSSLPWTETLTVIYPETIDVDVEDDLNRELAFYKQALHSAQNARSLAQKAKFPFTRPTDYFAEMVKSDSHMERIRQRLLDESAGMKRSEEKRKEREGKKFGKQVQLEKIKERQQNKKAVEERLKGLKRKRKDALDGGAGGDEDFDVAVEDALADRPSKRTKGPNGKSKLPRVARDKKFGFGGAGRRSKQNTKDSTDSFVQRGGPGGKGKGKGPGGQGGKGGKAARGGKGAPPTRPGKSRRMAQRSRA